MTGSEQAGAALIAAVIVWAAWELTRRAYLALTHRRPCRLCMWHASIPGTAYCTNHITQETT